jgi:poly [ADP-ribose] polymerase
VVEAVQTVAPVSGRGIAKHELVRKAVADIAKSQNPELTSLITYFADVNAHNIMEASGGKITYDASAGTFSTTQGVVTLTQVQKARNLLNEIAECADRSDYASDRFKSLINPYMALIPQKGLVRQMDFHSMFSPNHGLVRQNDMLDALESSYASVLAASRDKKDEVAPVVDDALFKVDLDLVEDGQEISRIRNFYETTKGSHADVKHFAVKRCFKLRINHMTDAFKAQPWGKSDAFKQYNVWELFHGSKASNMLSILKAGFMIPPKAAPHVCGRLYGDGVYASDMSSKALRYSTGAWGGGGNVERKFMFLVKFAMGMTQRIYQPSGGFRKLPAGYDSCYAKAGQSGVLNNEMIVYSLNRIEPMRLIEFTPYGK